MKIATSLLIVSNLIFSVAYATPNPLQDSRVKKVYDSFKNNTLWTRDDGFTPCGQQLINTLSHVEKEGLWASDYTPLLEAISQKNLKDPEERGKADALLTLATLNYISDMKGERLNPRAADRSIHLKQIAIDEADMLTDFLSQDPQCRWVETLAPSSHDYQKLKELLASYRQKKAQGGWPQLPQGTKLKKGDQGPLVEILQKQLIAQDALPPDTNSGSLFDGSLEEAVKNYQNLHGLEDDGVVGPATLAALNMPVEKRIEAIIVSMERTRWLPNPLPLRYIQVNIPGFYLRAVDGGRTAFDMPIITGKKYTKTPVFTAPMEEIIFNPAWHVPASIVGEVLPKMRRNPGAYARKGYHIYENPFRIVQAPGKGNALGKIRFTIKSPFSIYLHGTPSQHLFDKAKRSFSHGCIRVENPDKLAEFVFDNIQKWPLSRIEQEASGHRTKRVRLDESIPVFINYFTIFEDENGAMHFVPDEYGQDQKLWDAMKKARRYSKDETN